MITIEKHNGIKVLRDDLLIGGTKSILMPTIINTITEHVYASPVYGGFQIALSAYLGSLATIFCAKRNIMHPNTKECIKYGAKVIEVPYGYLSVVEKKAKDYCLITGAKKLVFGANEPQNKIIIGNRMKQIIQQLGKEPDEIWCALGSGTLVESILQSTHKAEIKGVQVGAEYKGSHERLQIIKYDKPFEKESKYKTGFQSMPNYDLLKAWEYCNKFKTKDDVLFWNVL